MEEKKYKIVFNAGVARNILKRGCPIVDIKGDRNCPEKTLFVFERTPMFETVFAEINEQIRAREQANVQ